MRPKIICHMVSSVDGRLLADRWTAPVSGTAEGLVLRVYDQVGHELGAQAWLVGRKTMEGMVGGELPELTSVAALPREPYVADKTASRFAIVVDRDGGLTYSSRSIGAEHLLVILGSGVSDQYLAALRSVGISYVFAGANGSDLQMAMTALRKHFGIETLLLEGGGIINGAFLSQNLIDELSLLIYPGIDGLSGVPSIFEYRGRPEELPAKGRCLRLLSSEVREGGMVWVRYRIEAQSQD